MYFFLGIISKENMNKGIFIPSEILCKKKDEIQKVNISKIKNYPLILTDSYIGHEDLYDYFREKNTLKGGLFWFMCNKFGDRTGPVIYITNTPVCLEKTIVNTEIKTTLSKEPNCIPIKESEVKKIIAQKKGRK